MCPSDTKPPPLTLLKIKKSYLFCRSATVSKSVCLLFCFLREDRKSQQHLCRFSKGFFSPYLELQCFLEERRCHTDPTERQQRIWVPRVECDAFQRFWMLHMAKQHILQALLFFSSGAGSGFLHPFADGDSDVPMPAHPSSVTEQNLLIPVPCSWAGVAVTASSGIQGRKCTSPLSLLWTAADKASCSPCCLQHSS